MVNDLINGEDFLLALLVSFDERKLLLDYILIFISYHEAPLLLFWKNRCNTLNFSSIQTSLIIHKHGIDVNTDCRKFRYLIIAYKAYTYTSPFLITLINCN